MDNNKYLECCLELGDNIKPFIQTGQNGKKYLFFRVLKKKDGPDQYGKTHNLSIRYKADDQQYYTLFIGNATEKEFPNRQTPPPPAQGGYAPQAPQQQYRQAPPQGAAEVRQQYQQGYAPQAPASAPAPQNLPPQAPPPTFADAPAEQTEDLPFES